MKKIFLALVFAVFSSSTFAADLTIEMLNKNPETKKRMVYSQEVAKIDAGQTIEWVPTDKGHNVEFIKDGVPDGVEKFKSKYNEDVEYTFNIPGIYAYWCTPHKNMGMIGFVVVGDDKSNLDKIKNIRFSAKSKKIAPDLINSL